MTTAMKDMPPPKHQCLKCGRYYADLQRCCTVGSVYCGHKICFGCNENEERTCREKALDAVREKARAMEAKELRKIVQRDIAELCGDD